MVIENKTNPNIGRHDQYRKNSEAISNDSWEASTSYGTNKQSSSLKKEFRTLFHYKSKHKESQMGSTSTNTKASLNSAGFYSTRDTEMDNLGSQADQSSCVAEACIQARQVNIPPNLGPSPWHSRKTIYLISIIGLLILWVVLYSILNHYNVL